MTFNNEVSGSDKSKRERTVGKAIEEVSKMEPSLPDDFKEMPSYAHYGSGAQNNNISSGNQHNNSGTRNHELRESKSCIRFCWVQPMKYVQ